MNGGIQPKRSVSMFPGGFSLVELMIAMAVGLAMVGAVSLLSLNATRSYRATNQANQQLEAGRYALSILKDDLEHAGYYGVISPLKLTTPAVDPADPCDLQVGTHIASLALPVRGYTGSPGTCNLTDIQPNTDVLVVRRAESKITSPGSLIAGHTYIQTTPDRIIIAVSDGTTQRFTLRKPYDESLLADIRRYHVHIYYVRSWANTTGDGLPTLVRRSLTKNGTAPAWTNEPLVEGIENLQIQYGQDAPSGTVCPYISLPADCDGAPGAYVSAGGLTGTDWANVVTVRINLLVRSLDREPNYTDSKSYDLGTGSLFKPDTSVSRYPRHVFSQVVRLIHPGGWRDREK